MSIYEEKLNEVTTSEYCEIGLRQIPTHRHWEKSTATYSLAPLNRFEEALRKCSI